MTFRNYIILLLSFSAGVAALTFTGLVLTWRPWSPHDGGKIDTFDKLGICLCGGVMASLLFLIVMAFASLAFWLIQKRPWRIQFLKHHKCTD